MLWNDTAAVGFNLTLCHNTSILIVAVAVGLNVG
jgi:hypothetical protein